MLNPASMQSALLRLSQTARPSDPATAAREFVSAYQSYAAAGQAAGFPLATPGPGAAAMSAPLIAAYSMPLGTPPVVAQAVVAAVVAYWSGAVFAGGGIAAPPVAAPALLSGVSGLLAAGNNPAEVYAAQMATLLDACTRSVLVTFPGPPPFVSPVI